MDTLSRRGREKWPSGWRSRCAFRTKLQASGRRRPRQGALQGTGLDPFCVAWVDRFAGEAGFRITLSYSQNSESRSQSGEVFTHTTSPNEVEFIFPASDRPHLTADVATCLQRNSYQISVVAVFPGGREEPVGSFGSIVECARR